MGKNKQKTIIRKTELGRTLFKSRFNKNESGPNSERWVCITIVITFNYYLLI